MEGKTEGRGGLKKEEGMEGLQMERFRKRYGGGSRGWMDRSERGKKRKSKDEGEMRQRESLIYYIQNLKILTLRTK